MLTYASPGSSCLVIQKPVKVGTNGAASQHAGRRCHAQSYGFAAQAATDRLRREADQQADRIVREADARADGIVSQANQRASSLAPARKDER